MTRVVPHGITFVGHGLTLAWLLGAPLWIGALGLLCDAADGFSARRLHIASPYCPRAEAHVHADAALMICVPMRRIG